jgi:hypothetical protein
MSLCVCVRFRSHYYNIVQVLSSEFVFQNYMFLSRAQLPLLRIVYVICILTDFLFHYRR